MYESIQGFGFATGNDVLEWACFSRDITNEFIATAGHDNKIRIWNSTTAELVSILEGHQSAVYAVCFTPDGNSLVSGAMDSTIKVWAWNSEQPLINSITVKSPVTAITVTNGGDRFAYSLSDGTVILADQNLCPIRQIGNHTGQVFRVVFSPDGENAATASNDQTVLIHSTIDGSSIGCIKFPHAVVPVEFSDSGALLVAGSEGGVMKIFDIEKREVVKVLELPVQDLNSPRHIRAVKFTANDKELLSGGFDGCIRLWDIESGSINRIIRPGVGRINCIAMTPRLGGQLLAAGETGAALISTEKVPVFYDEHAGPVRYVSFSNSGKELVSCGFDKTVRIWCLDSGKERLRLIGHESTVNTAMFSLDDQKVLSSSEDGTIRVWSSQTGKGLLLIDCPLPTDGPKNLPSFFTPSGQQIVSGSLGFAIKVWDACSGTLQGCFEGHKNLIISVKFSPDLTMMASASVDKTVRLWKIKDYLRGIGGNRQPKAKRNRIENDNRPYFTASSLAVLEGHTDTVSNSAFSPDGQLLASCGHDHAVILWKLDGASTKLLMKLSGHTSFVRSVFFLGDGYLRSASWDETMRVWDVESGKEVHKNYFDGAGQAIHGVSVSPDKKLLAYASWDKSVRLMQLDTDRGLMRLQGQGDTPVRSFSLESNTGENNSVLRVDWFQKIVDQGQLPELQVTHTAVMSNEMDFGFWVKQSPSILNAPQIQAHAKSFLIKTSGRNMSQSFLRQLLLNAKISQRPAIIESVVNGCFHFESIKLQQCFDFLQDKDRGNLELLLELSRKHGAWIPLATSNLHPAVLKQFFLHVIECTKNSRSAIKDSDWKIISPLIPKVLEHFPMVASSLFKGFSYYPAQCFRDNDFLFAQMDSDVFFPPLPENHDFDYGILSDRKTPVDKLNQYLESIYQSKCKTGSLKKKIASITGLKGSSTANFYDPEPVVICYIPIHMFYGKNFRLFANNADNLELLSSPAVKLIAEFKWQQFAKRGYIIWLSAFLIYLALFFALHFSITTSPEALPQIVKFSGAGILGLFSVCFLSIEISQISQAISNYFSSITNYVDLYAFVIPPLHVANLLFNFIDVHPSALGFEIAFTTLMLFFELLSLIIVSGDVGRFVRMFFEVIKETRAFAFVLFLFLVAFLVAFTAQALINPKASIVLNLYFALIGQSDLLAIQESLQNSINPLADTGTIMLFVIFTFFVMIIMFNILIAIVGDTYSRITENVTAEIIRSRLSMISKIENLTPSLQRKLAKTYQLPSNKAAFPEWIFYVVKKSVYTEANNKDRLRNILESSRQDVVIKLDGILQELAGK